MFPFQLLPPTGFKNPPIWNGSQFIVDGKLVDILEYSENFSGWSDDLTSMHEDLLGDSHPIDRASRADALLQIQKNLHDSQNVILEIGCSSGYLLRKIKENFPMATVIGADVVREPLFKLFQALPGVPLMRFDLLRCPLPNYSIDALILLNVLEHIEDDELALQRVFNLLKPGGFLVVEVPAGPYLYDAYDKELSHFRRYSKKELARKLEKSGFMLKRSTHLGFIIFPAFALVKLINKLSSRAKDSRVKSQAGSTSQSLFIKWALKFEQKYLTRFSLPFGIRVLITAQKI